MGVFTAYFGRTQSLLHNFSWTLLGNVVYSACQWGVLVALAKFGTPDLVGQYSLGLAVTAPIIMFANLQLRGIQATDAERRFAFAEYFTVRLVTTLAAAVVIVGAATTRGFTGDTLFVVLAIGASKCVESFSDVVYGFFQKYERMDLIAVSLAVKGCVSLFSVVAATYLTHSVVWAVVVMLGSWAAILLMYDLRYASILMRQVNAGQAAGSVHEALATTWDVRKLLALSWRSLPLGFVAMLLSLNANIPRYFIQQRFGAGNLGIFSAMAYVLVAGGTVVSALSQSAVPRLAKYYASRSLTDYSRLLKRLVVIGFSVAAVGVIVVAVMGRQLLTMLYTSEYAHADQVFIMLMVAAGLGFVGSFLGCAITAAHYFTVQLPLFMLVTATTAVSCAVLVPKLGMLGAAYAMTGSAVVQVVGSACVVAHAVARLKSDHATEGGQ